ncbi:hypothetical protein [Microvirga sp. VF16]|uniref:hypothetical protein n=1 Tax=Microvirga sp. VF16 TaxID=2807101 RepID=UPI00193D24D1|nr:hypothetical protein [Microvirga sp. VF16]QRM35455.1 hypothetical protein JO965_44775 [Microvirga sp. VF16]
MAVMLFVLSDVARRRGKKIEPEIEARMGGRPSITMLRHDSGQMDPKTRDRYVMFLAGKLNEKAPTKGQQRANPEAADAFYVCCGAWLREHTRDTKKFHILFGENITYGFRHNLLGMKPIALVLNILTVIACVGIIAATEWPLTLTSLSGSKLLPVLVIALFHAVYLIFVVTEASVVEASKQYSRQLFLSCEPLMQSAPVPKPRQSRPKVEKK